MAAIVVSQHARETRLTGVAGACATARDMARRALGYAAATVLICGVGAAVAQLVAEILSFPAPIASTAITLIAVALLHSLRRHLNTTRSTGKAWREPAQRPATGPPGSDRRPARTWLTTTGHPGG
jgi:hypothetical protein